VAAFEDDLKKEGELRNQLKAVRTRLGISQQELATTAGIARQTIGGIEAGTYAVSLTVALHLAKALGCSVDELFWLEGELPTVEAALLGDPQPEAIQEPVRVALAQVGGRWVASPLVGDAAFRQEMVPADGLGTWDETKQTLSVQMLDTPDSLEQTVLIAGCTPALSLWTRSAERWHPGLRARWLHANSQEALDLLAHGEIHIAGIHLFDLRTGDDNAAFVRKSMNGIPTVLVNLGAWEEGFLVAPDNPKSIRDATDLTRDDVRFVNRDSGAGCRLLLDSLLAREGMGTSAIPGYHTTVRSHQEIARQIQAGKADTGISTAGIAASYGLSFLPLQTVRYDLVLRKDELKTPSVQLLLNTLHHRWVRSQLATLGGYDISRTGEITDVS
jgi:putative molybdopterin biosynthesis protein